MRGAHGDVRGRIAAEQCGQTEDRDPGLDVRGDRRAGLVTGSAAFEADRPARILDTEVLEMEARHRLGPGASGIGVARGGPGGIDRRRLGGVGPGLHLAERPSRAARAFGRGLVKAMPAVMSGLSTIGTVAMLWVGGGILLHGSHTLGLAWPAEPVEHLAHAVATALGPVGPVAGWLTTAVISGVIGVVVGGLIALVLHHAMRLKPGAGH